MITSVAKKLISMSMTDYKMLGQVLAQVLDLKSLSTDLVAALTDRATRQKDVIIEIMAKEFSNFLSKINIAEEAQKIMDGMTVNITATVQFKDKSLGNPSVKISTESKRVNRKGRKTSGKSLRK